MITLKIPTSGNEISVVVKSGTPFFIVGRNGTGKSALVHHLLLQLDRSNVIYLPGSRTSLFDAEGLNLTPSARSQLSKSLRHWDSLSDTRWRNIAGNNSRNEKALHDLVAKESKYKVDLANKIGDGVDVEKSTKQLQSKSSPLDKANALIEQANLSIRLRLVGNDLRVVSGEQEYSYARMSDGERSALILIAEVVAATDGAIFIIDEPELHLHRAIVVPLIRSMVKARLDCTFIVSTHELELPTAIEGSTVCLIRSVVWSDAEGRQKWTLDIVEGPEKLPEDLRRDILGSRKRVLFTEGDNGSLDVPLYAILFPNVSVRPKGGCKEVQKAVAGTRSTSDLHHTEAFGLIDNDGMSPAQVEKHLDARIFALPVFSVESLYYDPDVLAAVAARQAETLEGDKAAQKTLVAKLVVDAIAGAISAAGIGGVPEYLAGDLAERAVRDDLISKLPKRSDLVALTTPNVAITIPSPYPAELKKFNDLRTSNDAYSLIGRYRVRSSGMLKAVAKALRFSDRDDYESAARSCLSSDEGLRDRLRAKLEPLATALTTP